MDQINLSPTAQKILAVYFANPGQKFYVNELIRKTGKYPNSVQQALKSLEKQKILLPSRRDRFKFHALNKSYKFLPEIEEILRKQRQLPRGAKKEESQWIKILNRQAVVAPSVAIAKAQRDVIPKFIGVGIDTYWHNMITGGIYYPQDQLIGLGIAIGERLRKDPEFVQKATQYYKDLLAKLIKTAKTLPQNTAKLRKLTSRQLGEWLSKYEKAYCEAMAAIVFPEALEEVILREIKEELERYLTKLNKVEFYDDYLEKLSSPVKQEIKERNGILKIAAHIKKHGWDKKAHQLIDQHTEEFAYLPLWPFINKLFDRSYFEEELRVILKKVGNPLKEIKRGKKEEKKRREMVKNLLREVGADADFKRKVDLLQEYIFLRTFRNDRIRKAEYYHLPLLHEIARSLGISFIELSYFSYDEMLHFLKYGDKKKLVGEIEKRRHGGAFLIWKGRIKIIAGVKNVIEAIERYRIMAPGPQAVKVVKGNPACRGKATGRVKIVRKLSELNKVEEGDILVAKMTTPDYLVAIHKAAAIVTDEGGVTCHAAIVSREFNLPCIMGTKNATQILSDNDLVEVDADEGVVRVVEAMEIDEDAKEIYGKTAYKGKVRGSARIVLDANDFPKVKEGDILVAPQTTPEYLSSLYKVKGFIVDEESITSHAMLYAKALKLPAIIGTQFARNLLQDGEKIELDASNGLVKRLSK